MLMPSIFEDDLFDDFFRYPSAGLQTAGLMKTDIKDLEDGYEVTIDMPGVKKEDIQADLKLSLIHICGNFSRIYQRQRTKQESWRACAAYSRLL